MCSSLLLMRFTGGADVGLLSAENLDLPHSAILLGAPANYCAFLYKLEGQVMLTGVHSCYWLASMCSCYLLDGQVVPVSKPCYLPDGQVSPVTKRFSTSYMLRVLLISSDYKLGGQAVLNMCTLRFTMLHLRTYLPLRLC